MLWFPWLLFWWVRIRVELTLSSLSLLLHQHSVDTLRT